MIPIVEDFFVEELLAATGGVLIRGRLDARLGAICTDSRQLAAGQTFWAIPGERFDGHEFVEAALSFGAAGVVVERDSAVEQPGDGFVVKVADSVLALGALAKAVIARRRQLGGFTAFAITGSNGKTTTKEMLAAALGAPSTVLKTAGNFNNWIGLPLTAFRLTAAHSAAVFEMGANAPGEIRHLVHLVEPDVCLLTCVAPAHLEGFGSLEGVAAAKGELFTAPGATRFVLTQESLAHYPHLVSDPRTKVVGESGAVAVSRLQVRPKGNAVRFLTESGVIAVDLPLLGAHNATNFALVVAALEGSNLRALSWQECADAIVLPGGRLQVLYVGDIEVIQDAYNANPASVRAALQTLEARVPLAHRVLVLGEMRELGVASLQLHREIGQAAAALAPRLLITVGEEGAIAMADAALDAGLAKASVSTFRIDDLDGICSRLLNDLVPGDVLLLKGSRSIALERVSKRLGATPTAQSASAEAEEH